MELKNLKVGDLVMVHCHLTNSTFCRKVDTIDLKDNVITYYSGVHEYWARANQLKPVPGQDKLIPELKDFLNGIEIVETVVKHV